MRTEVRWSLAAILALVIGVTGAQSYARIAAPFYGAVARLVASHHPWQVSSVEVKPGRSNLTAELQLHADVFRYVGAPEAAARVTSRVQVGEVIETPLVFWTLLLVWPATSIRQWLIRVFVGIPVFAGLEAITTATQLMLAMPQASAILAGNPNPVTAWDRWSRFLEGGGQFVLACGFAIPITSLRTHRRRRIC